jgi:hypothetical protein
MQKLYNLALNEGEGLGTAYEYYVKLKLIKRLLNRFKPNSVLIYGLPQKYGFSLDFFYYCHIHGYPSYVYENRSKKLNNLFKILNKLNITKPIIITKIDKQYDLILSCEVLQNIKNKQKYIQNIQKFSKQAIIFTPNKDNIAHQKISHLNGLTLLKIKNMFTNIKQYGYIDLPPFPPGIKKQTKIKNSYIINILKIFGIIEKYYPLKKKIAHIVYVYIKNN